MLGEARPAVDLDQQLGQVDLRQPRLDQLPQPPVLRAGDELVDEEVAAGEPRLGGGVSLAGEAGST